MKQIWFFLSMLTILLLMSCGDDLESVDPALIGVWSVDEIFLTEGVVNFEIGDTTLNGEFSLTGKDITTILILNEDFTMSSDGNYLAETSYKFMDEVFDSEVFTSDFGGKGTWYQDGRQIIIEQDSIFHSLNIVSVTEDSLSLFFPLNLTIDEDSIVSNFKGTLNYNLSR